MHNVTNRVYLAEAFGWDTTCTSKVAIVQLREENAISKKKCIQAQLIKTKSITSQFNLIKILGYIPKVNLIAGIIVLAFVVTNPEDDPNRHAPYNRAKWFVRGVTMVLAGPVLFIVDLVAHVYHCFIANQYSKENQKLINAYDDIHHEHNRPPYPGHPVMCKLHTILYS